MLAAPRGRVECPKSTRSPQDHQAGCRQSMHLSWTLRNGLHSGDRVGRQPPQQREWQQRSGSHGEKEGPLRALTLGVPGDRPGWPMELGQRT